MGSIEWTGNRRWPVVTGCTPVGPACDNCWAARLAATRLKHHPHYAGLAERTAEGGYAWTGAVHFNRDILDAPLTWRKHQQVFPVHTGDLFHPAVTNDVLHRIFGVMAATRHIVWQVLTKRPVRAAAYLRPREHRIEINKWQQRKGRGGPIMWPLPNVWLGTTVWDQASARANVPALLDAPAARRFVSAEPLLGPVDLTYITTGRRRCQAYPDSVNALTGRTSEGHGEYDGMFFEGRRERLDWVIVGGESGARARPMEPAWVRALRDACQAAAVPFFMKQMAKKGLIPSDLLIREAPGA